MGTLLTFCSLLSFPFYIWQILLWQTFIYEWDYTLLKMEWDKVIPLFLFLPLFFLFQKKSCHWWLSLKGHSMIRQILAWRVNSASAQVLLTNDYDSETGKFNLLSGMKIARKNFRWRFFVVTLVCALGSYSDICAFDHKNSRKNRLTQIIQNLSSWFNKISSFRPLHLGKNLF